MTELRGLILQRLLCQRRSESLDPELIENGLKPSCENSVERLYSGAMKRARGKCPLLEAKRLTNEASMCSVCFMTQAESPDRRQRVCYR